MNPRDPEVRFGIPYDYITGKVLTDAQIARIQRLREAHGALLLVMHEAEGSDPGNPAFNSRSMAVANTQIEVGMYAAYKAALEAS